MIGVAVPLNPAMAVTKRRLAAIFGISLVVGALCGVGLVAAAQRTAVPPIRLVEGNLTLSLHGAEVHRSGVRVEHVSLEIRGFQGGAVVSCACEYEGKLEVQEYRYDAGRYVETDFTHRVSCKPSTGTLKFFVEPDPGGDYRYELDAPGFDRFGLSRCELIEL